MIRDRLLRAVRFLEEMLTDEPRLEPEPPRPKVGAWIDEHGLDSLFIYDDHGNHVAGVAPLFQSTIYSWSALRPFLPMACGEADTKEEAKSRALAVLATWADVSAIQGQGVRE